MTWNLFLDDERSPNEVFWADRDMLSRYHEEEWVIARSLPQVAIAIKERGCLPSFISFDHDLGEHHSTGHDIAKWLVDLELGGMYQFPEGFDFFVHSQNPIGKANIEGLLNGYLKAKASISEVPFDQDRFEELAKIAEDDDEGDITVGK